MISVIMSTYNETREELKQSIDSILNQTYKDFEFLIVNDNPDNQTLNHLLYEYKLLDKRIKIINNKKNMGLALSLNRAIKYASGTYVARMDADDISLPDRLSVELNYLVNNNLDMVSSFCTLIDESGKILPNERQSYIYRNTNIAQILKYTNPIIHSTVLIKKECLDKLKGYRQLVPAEDYDLWLRMIDSNMHIGRIEERLLYYRIRNNGISSSNKYKQYLTQAYVKLLHQERIKKGKDSFSVENYTKYIELKRYDNRLISDKFLDSYTKYQQFKVELKKGRIFSAIKNIILSLLIYKEGFKAGIEELRALKIQKR